MLYKKMKKKYMYIIDEYSLIDGRYYVHACDNQD